MPAPSYGKTWDAYTARVLRAFGAVDAPKIVPSSTDVDDALAAGLLAYARFRTRDLTAEIVGTGATRRLDMTTLTGWEHGYSALTSAERVVGLGTDDEYVTPLAEPDDYHFNSTTDVLLLASPPAADSWIRYTYTARHAIGDDAAQTTVPDSDAQAVVLLAVAELADRAARSTADQRDAVLGVDQVHYGGISSRWSDFADRARKRAAELLAPSAESTTAVAASATWRTRGSFGQPYASHRLTR